MYGRDIRELIKKKSQENPQKKRRGKFLDIIEKKWQIRVEERGKKKEMRGERKKKTSVKLENK